MKIIVGTPKKATSTDKGDILEGLATDLLHSRGYEVYEKLKVTGAELDLLCRSEANRFKTIYVECKAYGPDNNIQSDVLFKLFGIRSKLKYEEAWLVTTSELGKEAKGIMEEVSEGDEAKTYTFITPDKLVRSLIMAKIIESPDASVHDIRTLIPEFRKLSDPYMLFTDFGYFWVFDYLPHGDVTGYIFYDAQSSSVIDDEKLLNKLASLNQLDNKLDFSVLLDLLDGNKASRLKPEALTLAQEYLDQIDTLKFKIHHTNNDELRNSDVFVYPDLDLSNESDSGIKNSKNMLDGQKKKKIVIYGDDLSGKTTLLQQYQISLAGGEKVPILLNAAEIKVKTLEAFDGLLVKKFREQYRDTPEYERFFRSLIEDHKDLIVVLIDDIHNLGIKREEARYEIMRSVVSTYSNTIITAHRSSELEFMAKNEWKMILSNHAQYNILQLGHKKRDELIEKWLNAAKEDLSDSEVLNSKRDLADRINIATGKSFVPTHPFYLLTMLQLLGAGTNNSIKGTAYGELYTYLITNALGEAGAKGEDLDFFITYLSKLAFKLFTDEAQSINPISLEAFFIQHIDEMYIKKDFTNVHKLLVRARLLIEREDGYTFQFNYVRYYFVAKYLSDNFNNQAIQNTVAILASNLHKDRYANIIIFLIHHSKNSDLINTILAESKKLFKDVSVNSLSFEEVAKFNELITEQVNPEFKDVDPSKNREQELEFKDKAGDRYVESNEDINEALDLFGKIHYSFRLMEVLGQIANNYYGSLDGPTKTDILNELYELGLRSMNALLHDYEEYIDGLRSEIRQTIEKKHGKKANIEKLTNDTIYGFTQIIVFAFIKKISDSVMSKNLFPVIEKLEYEPDHFSKHLVSAAIKLNFHDELNTTKNELVSLFTKLEKNFLTRDVLRFLVLNHLYKYHVNHGLKQSICSNLGIKMVQPNSKLLAENAS